MARHLVLVAVGALLVPTAVAGAQSPSLPASSYEEVRAFFQALQQAGESVIVVRAPTRR
jgi:acetyl esterase/lipase